MQVQVASKTLKVTQALRDFAKQQASKLQKLHQRITKIQIFLDKRTHSKRDRNALVKYVVSLPGKTIVLKRKAHDMYEAIVDATDQTLRSLRKTKEKQMAKQRNGH